MVTNANAIRLRSGKICLHPECIEFRARKPHPLRQVQAVLLLPPPEDKKEMGDFVLLGEERYSLQRDLFTHPRASLEREDNDCWRWALYRVLAKQFKLDLTADSAFDAFLVDPELDKVEFHLTDNIPTYVGVLNLNDHPREKMNRLLRVSCQNTVRRPQGTSIRAVDYFRKVYPSEKDSPVVRALSTRPARLSAATASLLRKLSVKTFERLFAQRRASVSNVKHTRPSKKPSPGHKHAELSQLIRQNGHAPSGACLRCKNDSREYSECHFARTLFVLQSVDLGELRNSSPKGTTALQVVDVYSGADEPDSSQPAHHEGFEEIEVDGDGNCAFYSICVSAIQSGGRSRLRLRSGEVILIPQELRERVADIVEGTSCEASPARMRYISDLVGRNGIRIQPVLEQIRQHMQSRVDPIIPAAAGYFQEPDNAHLVAQLIRVGKPGSCMWLGHLPVPMLSILSTVLGCVILVLAEPDAASKYRGIRILRAKRQLTGATIQFYLRYCILPWGSGENDPHSGDEYKYLPLLLISHVNGNHFRAIRPLTPTWEHEVRRKLEQADNLEVQRGIV
jgi:hypothetical protein